MVEGAGARIDGPVEFIGIVKETSEKTGHDIKDTFKLSMVPHCYPHLEATMMGGINMSCCSLVAMESP